VCARSGGYSVTESPRFTTGYLRCDGTPGGSVVQTRPRAVLLAEVVHSSRMTIVEGDFEKMWASPGEFGQDDRDGGVE